MPRYIVYFGSSAIHDDRITKWKVCQSCLTRCYAVSVTFEIWTSYAYNTL